MQRKLCIFIFMLAALVSLTACDSARLAVISPSPSLLGDMLAPLKSPEPSTPADTSFTQAPPTASEAPALNNAARGELFRTFLSDNYQTITETCFCTITGIGFLDLDRDGGIEMLVFDAGASASMGVQFFDIVADAIECVSANMLTLGETFKGNHFSELYVTANHFDDFRLMQEKNDGESFFSVESSNGALDFRYVEQIRFGNNNGVLTLHSVSYKHTDYDDDGKIILETYTLDRRDASAQTFAAAAAVQKAADDDTGFTAQGVFVYDAPEYKNGLTGVLAMVDKALELSNPVK